MSETRIDSLGLETRFVNTFSRHGIHTIGDVTRLTFEDLISFRGIGSETVRMLRFALDQRGIPHKLPIKTFTKRYE